MRNFNEITTEIQTVHLFFYHHPKFQERKRRIEVGSLCNEFLFHLWSWLPSSECVFSFSQPWLPSSLILHLKSQERKTKKYLISFYCSLYSTILSYAQGFIEGLSLGFRVFVIKYSSFSWCVMTGCDYLSCQSLFPLI